MTPVERYEAPQSKPTAPVRVSALQQAQLKAGKATQASRAGLVRKTPFKHDEDVVTIGIDPGSRYTAMVIVEGETVVHASTLVRVGDEEPIPYARKVGKQLQAEITEYLESRSTEVPVVLGIEGITDPKGFNKGRRAAINPKDIVRTGVTAGALSVVFPDAIIVRPGNNGSNHISQYPESLTGRRPKDLKGNSKGAGTRGHEQSAYDVAMKARGIHKTLSKGEKK